MPSFLLRECFGVHHCARREAYFINFTVLLFFTYSHYTWTRAHVVGSAYGFALDATDMIGVLGLRLSVAWTDVLIPLPNLLAPFIQSWVGLDALVRWLPRLFALHAVVGCVDIAAVAAGSYPVYLAARMAVQALYGVIDATLDQVQTEAAADGLCDQAFRGPGAALAALVSLAAGGIAAAIGAPINIGHVLVVLEAVLIGALACRGVVVARRLISSEHIVAHRGHHNEEEIARVARRVDPQGPVIATPYVPWSFAASAVATSGLMALPDAVGDAVGRAKVYGLATADFAIAQQCAAAVAWALTHPRVARRLQAAFGGRRWWPIGLTPVRFGLLYMLPQSGGSGKGAAMSREAQIGVFASASIADVLGGRLLANGWEQQVRAELWAAAKPNTLPHDAAHVRRRRFYAARGVPAYWVHYAQEQLPPMLKKVASGFVRAAANRWFSHREVLVVGLAAMLALYGMLAARFLSK